MTPTDTPDYENLTWVPGSIVMGMYEVIRQLGEGGMGVVHQVKHLSWDMDLAVKSPRQSINADKLEREAENWIRLGQHPHVVTCYYVRIIDGIPCIFSEYVAGPDLHLAVRKRLLYKDGPDHALARILDIAIQTAWALAFTHGRGLTHEDVKPSNVLLGNDDQARLTDFGLSRARVSEAAPRRDSRPTLSFTIAYASPEQVDGRTVTPQSDVWSWGLTVLEMFSGETPSMGPLAPILLDNVLADGPPPGHPALPPAVAQILKECFEIAPAARPQDLRSVAARLQETYEQSFGLAYPRRPADEATLVADSLNNRGVSLLDLGQTREALHLFSAALEADALHPEASVNRTVLRWRVGELTDLQAVQTLREGEGSGPSWTQKLAMARLHIERGDEDAARRLLMETARVLPTDDPVAVAAHEACRQQLRSGVSHLETQTMPGVRVVSSSAHGNLVVAGGAGLALWQPGSGQVAQLPIRSPVTALAVSGESGLVCAGTEAGQVLVFDFRTRKQVASLPGHRGAVRAVALAQDGRVTCSAGDDGTVHMWETATGQEFRVLTHVQPVWSLAVSSSARRLLAGLQGGAVMVWDVAAARCLRFLSHPEGGVVGLALTNDGQNAVTGGEDGHVGLWGVESGDRLAYMRGSDGPLRSLSTSGDGHWAATGGDDGAVRLWDLRAPRCWRTLDLGAGRVHSVALAAQAPRLTAATADGVVSCWTFDADTAPVPLVVARPRATEELLVVQSGHQQVLNQVRAALAAGQVADALYLFATARQASGFERSTECLTLWGTLSPYARRGRLLGAWPLASLASHQGSVVGVACVDAGRRGYSLGADGVLRQYDLARVELTSSWTVSGSAPAGFSINQDGTVACLGSHTDVLVWDLASGRSVGTLEGHLQPVQGVAVDADGTRCVSVARDGTIRWWDLTRMVLIRTLDGHATSVALSRDGRRLAWASHGGTTRLLDTLSNGTLATLRGHDKALADPIFDALSARLVTGGQDRTVRVWSVPDGQMLRVFTGHKGGVHAVTCTPDGRIVVSAGKDNTLMVWDVDQGACVTTLTGHSAPVTAAALSADGRLCLSGAVDGSVRTWYLDFELLPWDEQTRNDQLYQWLLAFCRRRCPWSPCDATHRLPDPTWDDEHVLRLQQDLDAVGLGGLSCEVLKDALLGLIQSTR